MSTENNRIYREINAFIDSMDVENRKIKTLSNDKIYEDQVIDLAAVVCEFNPYEGDEVKLFVTHENPPEVCRIEPWTERSLHKGTITYVTKYFGYVNDNYIFFFDEKIGDWEPKKDDEVECMLISGQYKNGRDKFTMRCETINLHKEGIEDWFNPKPNPPVESVVSEYNERNMQFEGIHYNDPMTQQYLIPPDLLECLTSKKAHDIKKKLDEFIPAELTYKGYTKRLHALIYLDEIEMKVSFDKYKSREVNIEPERKSFSISCSKITELRPPISVGDKIHVRKLSKQHQNHRPGRFYRGVVGRIRENRFVLKFKKDFENNYTFGDVYSAEFFYNRTMYKRKHTAIDIGIKKLKESFLFPTKLNIVEECLLNVHLEEGILKLNNETIPWYKENLNTEQKIAVTEALRGQCRPLPFVVFGPPGTGKTSTLIEIILQIYYHKPDCRILIATQSNHAANIVACRLIESNSKIGEHLLRLVSNAVLDRKSLPNELHKYSASILNSNIDPMDCDAEVEENQKDIKRNCELSYIKDFKVIIGTCVGLGVLLNSEFSDGYFTNVFIDEAAQCTECDALIPISFVNFKEGHIVMAGDQNQLPPITLSNHVKDYGLAKSMLERYIGMYHQMSTPEDKGFDQRFVVKLRRNYRSLPSILNFYNEQFYNGQLIATLCGERSTEAMKLRQLCQIFPTRKENEGVEFKPCGINFVNVEGRNERVQNRKSWENIQEVEMIKAYVSRLQVKKFKLAEIGIITPYHAQVLCLKKELDRYKDITVGTVEEYQGEERDIIIISPVKTSGLDKALQFIFCPKRLNTALSRARILVTIFGKAELLGQDKHWGSLIEYCKENQTFFEGKEIIKHL